ncbi:MAG: response regulator receiver sensor signal transduction histidine kinase [Verrucomicrobiales bacterium]|nr:response regulator receiver sensor signal transduction histidine kinase [Verrucomicrobiales bacterium]
MNSQPRPETILVIDDQEQNIRLVGALLSMAGYEVIPATGAEQAFRRLAVHLPDLILLDLLMPDIDGLEVCRRLKADPRWSALPVIFLSASDDKNLIVEALDSGGVDYVTKPFNKAELLCRVRTHLALKKARDDLRHLAADKDELLGIMAHDLKNHLAGMSLSAGLLCDEPAGLAPRYAGLARNILESADRMQAFVRQFLSNQSAERLSLTSFPVDLVPILRSTVSQHTLAAAAKQISMVLEPPAGPVMALVDPAAAGQVFDNLLSNALKFSPPGRMIRMSVEEGTDGFAHFRIRDEGPGFSPMDRAKIFSRYARLSARPTAGEPSTGLGLSIVKRLAEAMRGGVSLESGDGESAHFLVLFRLAEEGEEA